MVKEVLKMTVIDFSKIPEIPTAAQLIDVAFRRASKVSVGLKEKLPPIVKARRREEARVRTVMQVIRDRLKKIVDSFPFIRDLHPFYRDLIDLLVGVDTLRKYLGAINKATEVVEKIAREHILRIRLSATPREAAFERRAAYGRIASFVKELDDKFEFLRSAREKMMRIPSIDPSLFTIVVTGYPNVGKSTFVKQVSSAKPEIAPYPFTTKNIIVGHIELNEERCQILDLPGVLDRPISKRNKAEMQAILALRHLANVMIFIVDPSASCGYTLDEQVALFKEFCEAFKEIPKIVAINKIDISPPDKVKEAKKYFGEDAIEMVAIEGIGVKEALDRALSYYFKEKTT